MAGLRAIWFAVLLSLCTTGIAHADQWVNGYVRRDGTQVQGHHRSDPDGNPYNNYSYPGNLNPYTGERARGNPDTYLHNYNSNGLRSYGSGQRRDPFLNAR